MTKIEMQTGNDEALNNLGEGGKMEKKACVIMLHLLASLCDPLYRASL